MSQIELRKTERGGAPPDLPDDEVVDLRQREELDGDVPSIPSTEPVTAVEGAPSSLKSILVAMDAVALSAAWTLWSTWTAIGPSSLEPGAVRTAVLAVAVTMATLAALHLYRARVCAVHAHELLGLARAVALAAVVVQASKGAIRVDVPVEEILVGSAMAFAGLLASRRAFKVWLTWRRRRGEHLRPVVVVGTNEEARSLVAMLGRNPQSGYRVVGILGDRGGVADTGEVPWLGHADDCAEVVAQLGANGAFLAASALSPAELNDNVRRLMATGAHVHLSSSLRGISARRVRLQPISREMLFYLEPARLRRWQGDVKRVIDVVLATAVIVVSAPVLLLCAAVIRLQDGGPVLFRQERVGRDGETFTLFKLRTMVLDAESRLDELADRNQRDGVLFKLDQDPRVTTFGKILRALSLDELPQLFNVLRGEMSLVGPRPALPSEVVHFDERLQARHEVLPGVTGLWQVEARDVPGLGAYTRLDLFYVENWSVGLDLAILFSTFTAVAGRAARILVGRSGATG